MNHVLAERAVTCEIRVWPNVEVGVVEHRPYRESLETLARVGVDKERVIHLVAPLYATSELVRQPLVHPAYPRLPARALDTAIAKLSELPAEEQDRIARWLLDEHGMRKLRRLSIAQPAWGSL